MLWWLHSQHCPLTSLGPQGTGAGLGVPLDCRLVPAPLPKPALPGWMGWAVAGRNSGYFWRAWLPAGGGGGKRSPNITESTSAGTYTEGRKLSPSLHPTSTLSQSSPCFPSLPTSSNKTCISYEFGPLLSPTQADRAPACHPFPWTHDSGHGPDVWTCTTQCSLVGSERQGRLRWVGQHSSHLNTSILCHPPCWQLASASPDESLNSFRANLHLND